MIDPSLYSWHIGAVPAAALAVAFAAAVILVSVIVSRFGIIVRKSREDEDIDVPGNLPGVSLIVSTHARAELLEPFLEDIYNQEYPADADVEVIIVNSDGEEYIADTIKVLQAKFPQLRSTFVPRGSRNLSRRKLAITLGIKAATQPVVLLTSGNCRTNSTRWLAAMMRHFAEGADSVIGSTAVRGIEEDDTLGAFRSFDSIVTATKRIPAAIKGRPVGADCSNLAYRRRLFFEQGGFSSTLNLNYGDDDIFVSELSAGNIVEAELAPGSILTTTDVAPRRVYDIERISRSITSHRLRRGPFIVSALVNLLWWIFIGASAAAITLSLPSLLPTAAVAVMLAAVYIPVCINFKKASAVLMTPFPAWAAPLFWLAYPFFLLRYKITAGRKIRNFTWQN